MSDLFSPVRLGDLALPSRIVMAPMTRSRSPGGVPTALNAEYYAQRAGAGLIVTEGTSPAPEGLGYPAIPGLFDAAQAAGWRGVAEAVHARGGRIFVQLMHTGRIAHSDNIGGATPVAPSSIAAAGEIFTPGGPKPHSAPRALTAAEIEDVIAAFAQSARLAVAAGLDGVEVHGANGYLVEQFLAPNVNDRADAWGGSIAKRARFLLAVTDAIAGAIGPGRTGVRLSPGGTFNDIRDPDAEATTAHVAAELAKRNLAYLHVMHTGAGWDVPALVRRHHPGTLILTGGYDRAKAETELAAGRADLIGFGTAFIANPDLPERLRRDLPLAEADRATFYGGDARGYTDYPAAA